jgi:hypothetical protein
MSCALALIPTSFPEKLELLFELLKQQKREILVPPNRYKLAKVHKPGKITIFARIYPSVSPVMAFRLTIIRSL